MKKNFITSLWVIAIIWIVFIANFIVFFAEFRNLGIKPRTVEGLIGIPLSPFLHANWGHLISNTVPLLILTFANTPPASTILCLLVNLIASLI